MPSLFSSVGEMCHHEIQKNVSMYPASVYKRLLAFLFAILKTN